MEEVNSQTPQKKPVIIGQLLLGIAIGAVVVGGGYYAWSHKGTITKTTTTTSSIASTTAATTTATPIAASTTPAATTAAATLISYVNSQYGFSMTLPASWSGYKIKSATFDGEVATLYVEMPTTDSSPASSTNDAGYYSPFAIGIYTPSQWTDIQAAGGPSDALITQTSQYVYAWSHANGIPATDWTKDSDIGGIIASFKAN